MTANKNSFRQKLKIFRILGVAGFIIAVSGAVVIMLGKMEDSVSCRGVVAGMREHELKSSVQSRITELHHRTGDHVKKGDLLLVMDDREHQEKLSKISNSINELEAEIMVKNWTLEVLRHDPLPKEYRHTEIELAEYRERVIKSQYEVEVFRKLLDKKVITPFDFQKKELDYVKNQAEYKKLEDDLVKLKSGMAEKIIGQAQAEIELLKHRLTSRKTDLVMLEKHMDDYRFTAPEDGTISSIPTRTGIYVEPGQSLGILAADGPKKFIAYVDEKNIYKVRENQQVRIASSQYNYFEHGYFNGKVYAIDELPQAFGTRNCYAVRIMIEESRLPLRLGSTGEAEIIIGRDYIFRVICGLSK